MNVFGDAGGNIDSDKFLEYIINQFPGDLKQMVEVRDELAVRQGSLSAAQEAAADRAAAAKELADAKAQAKTLLDDAKAKNAASAAKAADLSAKEKAFAQQEQDFHVDMRAQKDDLAKAQELHAIRAASVSELSIRNDERSAQLDIAEAALAARVKAFQEKVAALSV